MCSSIVVASAVINGSIISQGWIQGGGGGGGVLGVRRLPFWGTPNLKRGKTSHVCPRMHLLLVAVTRHSLSKILYTPLIEIKKTDEDGFTHRMLLKIVPASKGNMHYHALFNNEPLRQPSIRPPGGGD